MLKLKLSINKQHYVHVNLFCNFRSHCECINKRNFDKVFLYSENISPMYMHYLRNIVDIDYAKIKID